MKKDSLGSRIKENYENRYRIKLTRRTPVIIRLDGKAFHTLTKNFDKPFDYDFIQGMIKTTEFLCSEIQNVKCAYVQSDEISILLTDYDNLETEAWFDYNIQKITSVSASMAGVVFNDMISFKLDRYAFFDSRCFNIPKEEVCNYFIWRQQDWTRNSLQMLARSNFSHKELHEKNSTDIHEMLHSKNVNWNDLDSGYKNGVFVIKDNNKWKIVGNVIFSKNREIIEQFC